LNWRVAGSIEKEGLGGGPVNRGMTAGRPASAVAKQSAVVDVANVKARADGGTLSLRVAFEAEIGVALDEHFGIYRAVRAMTDDAAFAHGGVFKNERTGLFAVALGAGFVLARHGETSGWFHNVHAMGVVALDAIHFAFKDGMMLREMEFRLRLLVALETGFGIFAGIDDEFLEPAASGHGDVFASGAVAGFAAALAGHFSIGNAQSRVRAGGENAGDIGMTVDTRLVAHVGGAFDLQGSDHHPVGGTGINEQYQCGCAEAKGGGGDQATVVQS